MKNDWEKSYDVSQITNEIELVKEVSADGEVVFKGWHIRTLQAVLISAFNWHPEIPDSEKSGVMWRALKESGKEGEITPNSLKESVHVSTRMYIWDNHLAVSF